MNILASEERIYGRAGGDSGYRKGLHIIEPRFTGWKTKAESWAAGLDRTKISGGKAGAVRIAGAGFFTRARGPVLHADNGGLRSRGVQAGIAAWRRAEPRMGATIRGRRGLFFSRIESREARHFD